VALNPVAGDQEYVVDPDAVKVVELEVQIVTSAPAFTGLLGATVMH
jgi:hypothetical protein